MSSFNQDGPIPTQGWEGPAAWFPDCEHLPLVYHRFRFSLRSNVKVLMCRVVGHKLSNRPDFHWCGRCGLAYEEIYSNYASSLLYRRYLWHHKDYTSNGYAGIFVSPSECFPDDIDEKLF